MSDRHDMFAHFSRVAARYRDVRTTDEAPVAFIADALAGRQSIAAADVGCGAGRYDLLLLRRLPGLHLTCVDINPDMLDQLARHLAAAGVEAFTTLAAGVEGMPFADHSLDCVFTFNAVHHFDFPAFLAKADRMLRRDGELFIYTRTPRQNAESIWGRYFPLFRDKERRLFRRAEMAAWIEKAANLRLRRVKTFRYPRAATLDQLVAQAQNRHYSTFSLYADDEFAPALETFRRRIGEAFPDTAEVRWHDRNIMLHVGR